MIAVALLCVFRSSESLADASVGFGLDAVGLGMLGRFGIDIGNVNVTLPRVTASIITS